MPSDWQPGDLSHRGESGCPARGRQRRPWDPAAASSVRTVLEQRVHADSGIQEYAGGIPAPSGPGQHEGLSWVQWVMVASAFSLVLGGLSAQAGDIGLAAVLLGAAFAPYAIVVLVVLFYVPAAAAAKAIVRSRSASPDTRRG
jgi:hypothetical protein